MKIVAGLGCIDDYIRFVEAGADEFFCGYVPYEWTKQYGVMLPLNRREVMFYHVQIGSLEELRILRKMVEVYQVPVKITFNSLFYLKEQYDLIVSLMEQCIQIGFDTFIIADLALIAYIRSKGLPCKIHLSGETSEVNHLMMEAMNPFDITRYIFHRKNTIEDMRACIEQNPKQGLEYEAFILNEWCHFSGGFCNSLHCDELAHLCKVPYQLAKLKEEAGQNRYDHFILEEHNEEEAGDCRTCDSKEDSCSECEEELEDGYQMGVTGCGLCALPKLSDAGVTHLKLVGRGNYPDFMECDIRNLRRAITLAETISDSQEFKKAMKQELFPKGCSQVCYYRGEA